MSSCLQKPKRMLINTYHVTGLFLYSLKTCENLCFSYVFRGYKKEQSDMKWIHWMPQSYQNLIL